jgi:hypothetical protein
VEALLGKELRRDVEDLLAARHGTKVSGR